MEKYREGLRCIKCGCEYIMDKHEETRLGSSIPEAILRTCTRCGYRWRELPLDVKEELKFGVKLQGT
jgi:DNA-directed RNA polymerase subunit M/transcription elongation factor TFIIS